MYYMTKTGSNSARSATATEYVSNSILHYKGRNRTIARM